MAFNKVFTLFLLSYLSKTNLFGQCFSFGMSECNNPKLEILPGLGWDSLRCKEMAQVFNLTYNCRQTKDKVFLIPDEVNVSPIRKSDLALSSELIKHWSNYTDATAKSVNTGIGLGFENIPLLSLSGSFSDGYIHMKREQLKHSGLMTRTSARHEVYEIHILPEAAIVPELKKRLDRALDYEMKNETETVKCILEFIIRDFGTHYIKSVVAGGLYYTENFLNDKLVTDSNGNDEMLKLAAKADFASKIKLISASYDDMSSKEALDNYSKHLISTKSMSVGGELLKLHESVNDWTDTVLKKMGTIDRVGDPLFTLLSATHFPDVDDKILEKVGTALKVTIEDYYQNNAHEGCMQMSAPNFDPNANINSGQCENPKHSYKFGGVYTECENWGGTNCKKNINKNNPITGKTSCPNGYKTTVLITGKQKTEIAGEECEQQCSGMWWWKKCENVCHSVYRPVVYDYKTYWCAAIGNIDKETGYMFGGILKNTDDLGSCPSSFYPLKLTTDFSICVSSDYSIGFKNSIPFGGFFSCLSNNPIANDRRGCPDNYEQLLIGLVDECEVKYCQGKYHREPTELTDIPLRFPPYKDTVKNYMISNPSQCYKEEVTTPIPNSQVEDKSISLVLLISTSVVGGLLFCTLLCVGWVLCRRNAKMYSDGISYALISTNNGCKATKEFLTTGAANTGTFLSTKVYEPTAAFSKTAYNTSTDFMSRAWINTKDSTNSYVLIPVTDGLKKSIEFTKHHVADPVNKTLTTSWAKMKSRCFRSSSSLQDDLNILSTDDEAIVVNLQPQSANPINSSTHELLINEGSFGEEKRSVKRETGKILLIDGYKELPFHDSDSDSDLLI